MKKIIMTNNQYRKYKEFCHIRTKENRITFTKKVMTAIIIAAIVDMQFPFLLAMLGRDQIAETMGGLIVTEIIGIFLVYCLKAFFETREAERIRIREKAKEKKANYSYSMEEHSDETDEYESNYSISNDQTKESEEES